MSKRGRLWIVAAALVFVLVTLGALLTFWPKGAKTSPRTNVVVSFGRVVELTLDDKELPGANCLIDFEVAPTEVTNGCRCRHGYLLRAASLIMREGNPRRVR
jgi:hypothetical protein